MKETEFEKTGKECSAEGKAGILKARYRAAVEMRDGLKELFNGCKQWISEQPDFEVNDLKRFMVFSSFRVVGEKLQETLKEIQEVESIASAMLEKIQGADADRQKDGSGDRSIH